MKSDRTKDKVKVFISSKCDSQEDVRNGCFKYGVMRKALKVLLEETNMCNVYAFEKGTATSFGVVDSYMGPLSDADLIIIIVDNMDEITNATMGEINRVKALKKKCIYIFCDEREKMETELQRELLSSSSNPRYCIAHEFSDIPEMAYEAVIADILEIYNGYCRGRIDFIHENQAVESDDGNIEISTAEDSDISKDFLTVFSYTKYVLKKESGLSFVDTDCEPGRDYNCACLLGYIIGSSLTKKPDFDSIKQDIRKMHKGNIQKLMTYRYDAVEAYFEGRILECIKKLKEAMGFIDTCKNIPKWLLNDVAIDLRNMQIEADREKDIISLHSQGQEILDRDTEPLYYPVIDRIMSDYNEKIVEKGFKNNTQTPYTVNLGGADTNIDKVCNAFIVAYYYGSITHMILIRKRVCDYIAALTLELRNHKMFMFSVRLFLLSNEEKKLKQFLETYGENTNFTNDVDMDNLILSLEKQPVKTSRLLARENAIRFFGYYYSEDLFEKEANDILNEVKKCIENNYATSMLVKPLIDALNDNSYRFNESSIMEFIYFLFDHGCKRYYDDVFLVLYRFHFKNLGLDEQEKYQLFLVNSIRNDEIRDNSNYIFQAAQTLRQQEEICHKNLDEAVKEYGSQFYEDTYRLNIGDHTIKESWKYIDRFIKEIISDNQTQGKGGMYTGHSYDPFLTIGNIVKNDSLELGSSQLRKIIQAISGTIFSETQTIEAKYRAVELLCILQLNQPLNRQIKKLYWDIEHRIEEVLEAKEISLVKGFSKSNLVFAICILGVLLKQIADAEFGKQLVRIQNSEIPVQITVLSTIEGLLHYELVNSTSDVMDVFFQFLFHESYSVNNDVRFRAMSVLIKLNNPKYQEVCMERFIEIMNDEPYKTKVGLLYRFNKEDLTNPKVRYIFDKGKSDTHYWVRVAANRFGGE